MRVMLAYGLSQCPGDTLSRQLSLQFLINRESLSIHNKFTASFYKSEGVCQAQWCRTGGAVETPFACHNNFSLSFYCCLL